MIRKARMSLTFLLFFGKLLFERYSKETASFDKCCHTDSATDWNNRFPCGRLSEVIA